MRVIVVILSLTFCHIAYSQLADISYQVRVGNITSWENYLFVCGSTPWGNCWEIGDEEYTAYGRFKDNVNASLVSSGCLTCTSNDFCQYGWGASIGGRTNNAYSIIGNIDAWENDSDPRCTYFSAEDDCRRVGDVGTYLIREAQFPGNTWVSGPTWGTCYEAHALRLEFYWNYANAGSIITPCYNTQNIAASSGQIRSWRVAMTAGDTYVFSTCELTTEDTELRLFSTDGRTIVAQSIDACAMQSEIAYTAPSTGTYYMELSQFNRNPLTSNMSLNYYKRRPGSNNVFPIDVGTLTCSTDYSNTQNNATSNCFGNAIGQASDDIWYQFSMSTAGWVEVGTCSSGFDTYMHIANSAGTILHSNDDNGPLCAGTRASLRVYLSAGTYFAISEGYGTSSGSITTTIKLTAPFCDSIPPPNWSISCEQQSAIDIFGRGINMEDSALIVLPVLDGLDSLMVEVVCKGTSLPESCTIIADGTEYPGTASAVSSTSVPARVFRATLPPSTSVIVASQNPASTYSAVIYAFRGDETGAVAGSAVFAQQNLYQDSITLYLPIETRSESRDVRIILPISELNEDARYAIVRAQAGGIFAVDTVYAPTLGSSLNIVVIVLEDVPGELSFVEVQVISPPAPFGDSFLFSTIAATSGCAIPEPISCEDVVLSLGVDTLYICEGQQILLDAGPEFASYNWNTGDTSSSILVSSGFFSVSVIDSNGCSISDSIFVSSIVIDISPRDTSICPGDSLTLSTAAARDIAWSNGQTSSEILVFPDSSTTYILTVTNAGLSCSDSVRISVQTYSPPIFSNCPANIMVFESQAVFWDEPIATSTDSCSSFIIVEQVEGPSNGTIFPVGTTNVEFLASNEAGQQSSCQFTVHVLPSCPSPVELNSMPTRNSVTLSWTMDSSHLGVQVRGRRVGDAFFATTQTTSNSIFIGALTPATSYEWRARAKCLDGSISAFSPLQNFVTSAEKASHQGFDFRLHPNPADDQVQLTWTAASGPSILRIIDPLGREILQLRGQSEGSSLLMTKNWPSGLYLAWLSDESGHHYLKFVVEH